MLDMDGATQEVKDAVAAAVSSREAAPEMVERVRKAAKNGCKDTLKTLLDKKLVTWIYHIDTLDEASERHPDLRTTSTHGDAHTYMPAHHRSSSPLSPALRP